MAWKLEDEPTKGFPFEQSPGSRRKPAREVVQKHHRLITPVHICATAGFKEVFPRIVLHSRIEQPQRHGFGFPSRIVDRVRGPFPHVAPVICPALLSCMK
jgi:hypothetical protein